MYIYLYVCARVKTEDNLQGWTVPTMCVPGIELRLFQELRIKFLYIFVFFICLFLLSWLYDEIQIISKWKIKGRGHMKKQICSESGKQSLTTIPVPPSPGLSATCHLLLWHVGVTVRYNHICLSWLSYYIYPLSVTIANTSDNEAAL